MDLSTQLNHYMGLKRQCEILAEEQQAVENECSALYSAISAKLLQRSEGSSFEDPYSFKYNVQEGANILSIGKKFYSFHFDVDEYNISFLKEIEPIKIP